jgi:taurine dioxygenase
MTPKMNVQHMSISPMTGFTGAEVTGVDITRGLDDESASRIREALLEW